MIPAFQAAGSPEIEFDGISRYSVCGELPKLFPLCRKKLTR
jgi:hypothetical protein